MIVEPLAQRAQISATSAGKYLQVLRDLNLVRREVSAFERAPERRRKGTYVIEDSYVTFYFRFILPHLSPLASGAVEVVFDRFIAPHLSAYMGPIFEEICRQYIQRHWGECLKSLPLRVGSHRDRDFDLDVVALLTDGNYLIGECKWWEKSVGENILETLKANVLKLPEHVQRDAHLTIFSCSGFTDALKRRAKEERVLLVGLEQLLGA